MEPVGSPPDADLALSVLRARLPDLSIQVRNTKRSLLGLRRDPLGRLVLRLHPELLNDADYTVSIIEWAQRKGKGGPGREIRTLLHAASARIAKAQIALGADWAARQAVIGDIGPEDGSRRFLEERARLVQATWFADLAGVSVSWGRRPPARRLSHLRFGCYRRTKRCVELSPRLARPWIATVFLDHVLHHELCHHRQALDPAKQREGAHSPRFRTWERAFPGYDDAIRWERLALPWLLDDTPPPWYRHERSPSPCQQSDNASFGSA